jgi:tetratricopeptide (TPR) repeat protein
MNRQDLGLAESFTSSAHPCEDFNRRDLLLTAASVAFSSAICAPKAAFADDDMLTASLAPVEVTPSVPDAKKLFNKAHALESQGNMAAAQRLYAKVTKISPRFIYGWSNLGNTQVAMGDLGGAEENYSQAIDCVGRPCQTATAAAENATICIC